MFEVAYGEVKYNYNIIQSVNCLQLSYILFLYSL